MPKTIAIIDLPYYEDSQIYFDRMRELNGRAWLDSGYRSRGVDILSAEPLHQLKNVETDTLNEHLAQLKHDIDLSGLEHIPFTGGLIGYTGYENRHRNFNLDPSPKHTISNIWNSYNWALIQDHRAHRCFALFLPSCSEKDIKQRLALLDTPIPRSEEIKKRAFCASTFRSDMPRDRYTRAFNKIQQYIVEGDAYQVNFSQRFSSTFSGHIDTAYLHLRRILTGSYCSFLDFDDHHVLSLSPEQFIEIRGRHAQTKPIKGTIKRGETKEEDDSLALKLKSSEKDNAENLMIVDLLRNDFSQNCEPHSVIVPKLCHLESYANVHHLVSTIQGEVKIGVEPLNFYSACFPGGSITGAPKKRAMEIIAELETHPREVYCGSIGYVSTNGQLDSNIAIRTLLARHGEIFCWGGGGIVADSKEEEEYQESIQKVHLIMAALSDYNE